MQSYDIYTVHIFFFKKCPTQYKMFTSVITQTRIRPSVETVESVPSLPDISILETLPTIPTRSQLGFSEEFQTQGKFPGGETEALERLEM